MTEQKAKGNVMQGNFTEDERHDASEYRPAAVFQFHQNAKSFPRTGTIRRR